MSPRLRLIVWPGMPDEDGLKEAGERIGRELDITVISSNEDLQALLESEPPFDLITPSDYLVETLVSAGRLADISATVGEKWENLEGWARRPEWDPEERYSLPLAFGTTGLLVSGSRSGGMDTWAEFFDPVEGVTIGVLNEVREIVGAALIASGHSPNDFGAEALDDAARLLEAQKGFIVSISSDDFIGPVQRGEVDAHHAWSGPASLAVRNDPDLNYVVPREGALLWTTTAAIPVDAPEPEAAGRLLLELTDPAIAAKAVVNGGYSTPNSKARAALPAELNEDRVLFPDEETIRRCLTLTSLTGEGEQAMTFVRDEHSIDQERAVDSRT